MARQPSVCALHIHFAHRCRQYGDIPDSMWQPQSLPGLEAIIEWPAVHIAITISTMTNQPSIAVSHLL